MAHQRALKLFIVFSVHFDKDYRSPSIQHILAFMQYLTTFLRSPASVRNTISSLTTAFKRLRWNYATLGDFNVNAALKSIHVNSRYTLNPKLPIETDQLDKVVALVLHISNDYAAACVFIFRFAGFFWQSQSFMLV